MKKYIIVVATILLLVGCGKNSKEGTPNVVYEEYLPFKFSDEGKWGMVRHDGKILFSEMYEDYHSVIDDDGEIEEIDIDMSPALNGLFLMTNKNNARDYYTAEKKPKYKFGGFKEAGLFYEDIAPTVRKGEWIKFVNKKGRVVFDFKEVNGVNVKEVSNFHGGIAIFVLENEQYGCIDTKGKVIVEPQSEEISFPWHNGYDIENGIVQIGNRICSLSKDWEIILESENNCVDDVFSPYSDYWAVNIGPLADKLYVIYDAFGREIKRVKNRIVDLSKEYYIFKKNEKYGIADFQGNIIMTPSYDAMRFIDFDKVLCGNLSDGENVKILDLSGKLKYSNSNVRQSSDFLTDPSYFVLNSNFCRGYNDGVTFIKVKNWYGEDYTFIDDKGSWVVNRTFRGLNSSCDDWIQSDYFDSESIVKRIKLTDTSVSGVGPNNTLGDFYNKFTNSIMDDGFRNYISRNNMLPISLDIDGVSFSMLVYFSTDVYPNYQEAFDEKPYVMEIIISSSNFGNSYEYSKGNDKVVTFFEYLYKYYCENYYIMGKEKKEKAFYLEISRANDANSIVAYHDGEDVHIVISESNRSLYHIYANMD